MRRNVQNLVAVVRDGRFSTVVLFTEVHTEDNTISLVLQLLVLKAIKSKQQQPVPLQWYRPQGGSPPRASLFVPVGCAATGPAHSG